MSGTAAQEVAEAQHWLARDELHESWSKPMQVARLQQSSRHWSIVTPLLECRSYAYCVLRNSQV